MCAKYVFTGCKTTIEEWTLIDTCRGAHDSVQSRRAKHSCCVENILQITAIAIFVPSEFEFKEEP